VVSFLVSDNSTKQQTEVVTPTLCHWAMRPCRLAQGKRASVGGKWSIMGCLFHKPLSRICHVAPPTSRVEVGSELGRKALSEHVRDTQ
jgi:hypothetical protein